MRRRTRARELAVQFLFQLDLRSDPVMGDLQEFLELATDQAEVIKFATRLVLGTQEHREEADICLREVARNWDLKRMAALDRNVLRMAVFELLFCPDIPPKVTINEAIEIGKKFSTANSGAFINGILDRVRLDRVERAEPKAPDGESETFAQDS